MDEGDGRYKGHKMRIEFTLHDERSGRPKLYRAADCSELAEIAEQLGFKKEIEALGHCWSWNEGEVRNYYGTEERRYDEIRLAPKLTLTRLYIWELK